MVRRHRLRTADVHDGRRLRFGLDLHRSRVLRRQQHLRPDLPEVPVHAWQQQAVLVRTGRRRDQCQPACRSVRPSRIPRGDLLPSGVLGLTAARLVVGSGRCALIGWAMETVHTRVLGSCVRCRGSRGSRVSRGSSWAKCSCEMHHASRCFTHIASCRTVPFTVGDQ